MKAFLPRRFAGDASGATAIEYALALPVLLTMILGGIWIGLLTFTVSSMDMAVQSAARCMAVDAVNCKTATTTQSYALAQYAGPNLSPVFTASATGCGHTVTGTASFDLKIVPGLKNVPLSVSACYP